MSASQMRMAAPDSVSMAGMLVAPGCLRDA